ncbi:MAG TPA: hypothetical protein VFY06_12625, partial [Verrucomicrobiae bacterium]|nr:hypothetical protein [Verrucomicrobiae bacterium]
MIHIGVLRPVGITGVVDRRAGAVIEKLAPRTVILLNVSMSPTHLVSVSAPCRRFGRFNDIARLARAGLRLMLVTQVLFLAATGSDAATTNNAPGVAVLLVDTDRVTAKVNEGIYGQFLEHINHSVVDGLFAEQIQGRGFEGNDFETYWKPFGANGSATVADVKFENGEKSVRLKA